jgi:uncharacterized membrane protein
MPRRKLPHEAIVDLFEEKLQYTKTSSERLADWVTEAFGSVWFLLLNIAFFSFWVAANQGWIPQVPIFDPYPYGLLTMVVSLEAIFLSIFVLVSQNRAAKIDILRDEVDFQVNVNAEKEVTKILRMLDDISHKLNVPHVDDPELEQMKEWLDLGKLERSIQKSMNGKNGKRHT